MYVTLADNAPPGTLIMYYTGPIRHRGTPPFDKGIYIKLKQPSVIIYSNLCNDIISCVVYPSLARLKGNAQGTSKYIRKIGPKL